MSSRSLMDRVFPPSVPPDGEHPQSFGLVVRGTQLHGSWYLSAIVRLQGFSSCSPAAPPRRWSPKTVTSSSMAGKSKPDCGLCPSLSLKGAYHPCWGGERGEPGLYLPHGSAGHLLFQLPWQKTAPGAALKPLGSESQARGSCQRHGRRTPFPLITEGRSGPPPAQGPTPTRHTPLPSTDDENP